MSDQRGVHYRAGVANTFVLGNEPEGFMLGKRFRLVRPLAALLAAAVVLLLFEAFHPAPVAGHPPPKHQGGGNPMQHLQREMEKQQRIDDQMVRDALMQQQQLQQRLQRLAEERRKHLMAQKPPNQGPHANAPNQGPHANAPKQGTQSQNLQHGAHPPYPPVDRQKFLTRKDACDQLTMAMHYVHSDPRLHSVAKQEALGIIHEALQRLHEDPRMPVRQPNGDHRQLAIEHLQRAHKIVMEAHRLPHETRVPVLEEIHRALFVLHNHHNPGAPFPTMEKARHELAQALHQVYAANGLSKRWKEPALENIRRAMLVLGEAPLAPTAPENKADHLHRAEEHLHVARKELLETGHLPSELRAPALWEIHNALFALTLPEARFPDMKETTRELVRAWD